MKKDDYVPKKSMFTSNTFHMPIIIQNKHLPLEFDDLFPIFIVVAGWIEFGSKNLDKILSSIF
jgi:hypothetical protein